MPLPTFQWSQFVTPYEGVRPWGHEAAQGIRQDRAMTEQERANQVREGHASRVQDAVEQAQGWSQNWDKYREQERQYELSLRRNDGQAEQKRKDLDALKQQMWGHDPSTPEGQAAQQALMQEFQFRQGNQEWNPGAPAAPEPMGIPQQAPQQPAPQLAPPQAAPQPAPQAAPPQAKGGGIEVLDPGVREAVKDEAQVWAERGLGEIPKDQLPPAPPTPQDMERMALEAQRAKVQATPGGWMATGSPEGQVEAQGPRENLGVTGPQPGADVPSVGAAMRGRAVAPPQQMQPPGMMGPNLGALRAQLSGGLDNAMAPLLGGQRKPPMDMSALRGKLSSGMDQALSPLVAAPKSLGDVHQSVPKQAVMGMHVPGMQVNPATPEAMAMKAEAVKAPDPGAIAPPGTVISLTAPDGTTYNYDAGAIQKSTIMQGRIMARKLLEGAPGADKESVEWMSSVMPELVRASHGDLNAAYTLGFDKIMNPAAERRTKERNARQASMAASDRGGASQMYSEYKAGVDDIAQRLNQAKVQTYMDARDMFRGGASALMTSGPDSGTVQRNAIIKLAKALDGSGRLSDFDVQSAPGLMSALEKVQKFFSENASGELPKSIKDQLLVAFDAGLKGSVDQIKRAHQQVRTEWDATPAWMVDRRDGIASVINGQFSAFDNDWFNPLPQARTRPGKSGGSSGSGGGVRLKGDIVPKEGGARALEILRELRGSKK